MKASGPPSWSPLGQKLAFELDGRIAVADVVTARTTGALYVTTPTYGERAFAPRWSPDGRHIVYLRTRRAYASATQDAGVWVMRADGSSNRPVTTGVAEDGFSSNSVYLAPDWAPGRVPATARERVIAVRAAQRAVPGGVDVGVAASGGAAAFPTYADTDVGELGDCRRIATWTPGQASTEVAATVGTSCYGIGLVDSLAVDHGRPIWVFRAGRIAHSRWTCHGPMSTLSLNCVALFAPGVPGAEPTLLAYGDEYYGGDRIGHLVSDGSTTVLNTWHEDRYPPKMSNGKLWRVSGDRLELIAEDDETIGAVDVDRGRVVVARSDGSLAVYALDGALLRAVPSEPGRIPPARLDGSRLFFVRDGRLEAIDITTGASAGRWPLRHGLALGPRLVDVRAGLAVYTAGIRLRVLRLATKVDRGLSLPAQGSMPSTAVQPQGVYATYWTSGVRERGRAAFVPWKTLAAATR